MQSAKVSLESTSVRIPPLTVNQYFFLSFTMKMRIQDLGVYPLGLPSSVVVPWKRNFVSLGLSSPTCNDEG